MLRTLQMEAYQMEFVQTTVLSSRIANMWGYIISPLSSLQVRTSTQGPDMKLALRTGETIFHAKRRLQVGVTSYWNNLDKHLQLLFLQD